MNIEVSLGKVSFCISEYKEPQLFSIMDMERNSVPFYAFKLYCMIYIILTSFNNLWSIMSLVVISGIIQRIILLSGAMQNALTGRRILMVELARINWKCIARILE